MSDHMGAMTESWRVQRRSVASDMQIKRMAVIAGAVVLVGAIVIAGYSYLGRRPHAVPVIEADSRPIRVRPDNPGGMQVAGADEQIMGGAGSDRADAMAPPPEAPQLGALRAQIQAANQPAPPPVAVSPPVVAPPVAAPPFVAPPVVAAPTAAPAAPGSRQPPPHAAAPAPTGRTMVQLASVGTEQEATSEWQRLSRKMPELLRSRQPALQRAERDGKQLWRVRTGGFADTAQATAFCTQVRAKGTGCTIASF